MVRGKPFGHKAGERPWEIKMDQIEDLWGCFPGIKKWVESKREYLEN